MKTSGIYSITNTVNGKIYYGSSNNCKRRWYEHSRRLKHNKHSNPRLQNAYNKYGRAAFKFEILKEVPVEQLMDVEQQYLDKVKENLELYYNMNYEVEHTSRGRKMPPHSEETKKKMSLAHKGKHYHTAEFKQKLSDDRKGKGNPMYGKQPHNRDLTEYTFKNRVTNEEFTGNKYDFIKRYKLPNQNVYVMIKNETNRKSCKNWILICKN